MRYICSIALVLLLSSCCRKTDDYLLPQDWKDYFAPPNGRQWVFENRRTGYRDTIYVCQEDYSWAEEFGHNSCKRREDLTLQYCSRSDTARSLSRMFRGFRMYAYADYDNTHYLLGPCMLTLNLTYKDGVFHPDDQEPSSFVNRLPTFEVSPDSVYEDVVHLGLRGPANTSSGNIDYYFAKGIGLVYAKIENYLFQPHLFLNRRFNDGVFPLGTDGVCDYEEPDFIDTYTYFVWDGEYRLVSVSG